MDIPGYATAISGCITFAAKYSKQIPSPHPPRRGLPQKEIKIGEAHMKNTSPLALLERKKTPHLKFRRHIWSKTDTITGNSPPQTSSLCQHEVQERVSLHLILILE